MREHEMSPLFLFCVCLPFTLARWLSLLGPGDGDGPAPAPAPAPSSPFSYGWCWSWVLCVCLASLQGAYTEENYLSNKT
uniref:HDC09237 n=1 Tax=Drosophila melanogaster TaxID=7227 RepID=Q6ILK0_DROME|nr:TPA_inf: HDC09237 [Drosophila melanogaster]